MPEFLEEWKRSTPEKLLEQVDLADVEAHTDLFHRLTGFCRGYRKALLRCPEWVPWLAAGEIRQRPFGPGSLKKEWETSQPESSVDLPGLRRFRQKMSIRIAFREINELAPLSETLRELSDLAEFCLDKTFHWSHEKWIQRLGEPWDEENDRAAELCVLGMGKLGGRELNFCSDVDLIFVYEGDGHCVREGESTSLPNTEFFTRMCQEAVRWIQERTADGFLYNVDLRLRPEGASGPLVRSLESMEHYYFTLGQTWERLAMLKARPVAGSKAIGGEFLEIVHAFRYPRHPPEYLPEDVAVLKERTESELLRGDKITLNLKTGYGGIREIEFFTQVLQLIHAGNYPFLQTESTREAISQLLRYALISQADADALIAAYEFLRRAENRLQMENESQVHELPREKEKLERFAASLGHDDPEAFQKELARHREEVRNRFSALVPDEAQRDEFEDWFSFFAGGETAPRIRKNLNAWFGENEEAPERLRRWVLGSTGSQVTREHVQLFLDLAKNFEETFTSLGNPLDTLVRLDKFAGKYGARKAFFRTCSLNPSLFEMLCLLFDRSRFIHDLLCRYPEIMEELITTNIRRRKSIDAHLKEMRMSPETEFAPWLWLYVKAEQVRVAMNEVLNIHGMEEVEEELSDLAEAAIRIALERIDPDTALAVIAMGKFGGREMTLGSDLDLLILGDGSDLSAQTDKIIRLTRLLGHKTAMGKTFDIDLRLRPHGEDGPLLVTPDALRDYHGNLAHPWEIQILTRARPVTGNEALIAQFEAFREEILWSRPLNRGQLDSIEKVRRRMMEEKASVRPPERAFKHCSGGLADIEFLVQIAQIQIGGKFPSLRNPNTRESLTSLSEDALGERDLGKSLLEHYHFLRRVELYLRRDSNTPETEIPDRDDFQHRLARWLGYEDYPAFFHDLQKNIHENRRLLEAVESALDHEPSP